jgi:putative transposase
MQAFRFALDPARVQERALASHCGASRFAYNWGLALVKDRLAQRDRVREAAYRDLLDDAEVERLARTVVVPWTLAELRREWNQAKREVAPWWPENSKEAYSSGFDGLARALKGFSDSKAGRRRGERVGFARFKRRGRGRCSCRFTTGALGVSGRTRVKLPRIGHVRTHEPTTKLLRLLEAGAARVLSATVSHEGGRWYCSLTVEVERADAPAVEPDAVVGVDVGVRHLAVLSTRPDDPAPNPRALERAQRRLRRYQRKLDRQRRANNPDCYRPDGTLIKGRRPCRSSARQRATERKISKAHAQVRHVRLDAIHKLTTGLAQRYGRIVVESLNVKGLCRGGNRGLRRAIHDASLAEIRRQLAYKTAWRSGTLIRAPTFYPSSKTCSACGTVKTKLRLSERTYRCEHCGAQIDRDLNAALNLAKLAHHAAGSGPAANAQSRPPARGCTENPRKTRPRRATGRPRSPHHHPVDQTGTAPEQSGAPQSNLITK